MPVVPIKCLLTIILKKKDHMPTLWEFTILLGTPGFQINQFGGKTEIAYCNVLN